MNIVLYKKWYIYILSFIFINIYFFFKKFQNEKELNDAQELIHRLSQYHPENRVATSFMQELHEDFGVYPDGNTRFNSTIIDDDNEDYHMEDDNAVEISQTHSATSINEKCLLDELLQTEEVKGNLLKFLSVEFSLVCIHIHLSDYTS